MLSKNKSLPVQIHGDSVCDTPGSVPTSGGKQLMLPRGLVQEWGRSSQGGEDLGEGLCQPPSYSQRALWGRGELSPRPCAV